MAEQSSKVSGILQIDGVPAKRTVRAFGYSATSHSIDGMPISLSKSLGHATSDPNTGEYTIDLLDGYDKRIFVVAFDDYGADFRPDLAVAVGDRVHPTTPNGHVWECTGSGTLPSEEPTWLIDTETAQLYGTASMIARPFYRPVVHGPVTPQVVTVALDDYFINVVSLLHMDEDWSDITGKTWTPINSPTFSTDVRKFGSASGSFINGPYLEGPTSDAWAFGNQDFTVECWAYATEMPAVYYQAPMGNWYSSTGGCFFLRPNGVMSWHSGSQQVASGAGVIQVAKWHHLAYARKNGVGRLFVDGVKVGPDLADSTDFTWTQAWRIGGNRVASDWWRGFVDEVRITKGIARYTENFTPPTKAFPNQGPIWTPSELFQSGESGAWYDPSDLTTLFQDVAGTIPVESDGDPVALMLDKSGLNDHMIQSTLSSRPIFRIDGTRRWLEFDGESQYMASSDAAWINSATQLLASTAVNIVGVGGDDYGGILSKSTGSDNSYKGFNLRESAGAGLQFFGLGAGQGAGFSVVRDQPMVVSGIWLSGSALSIYRDGTVQDQLSPSANNPNAAGQVLTLGKLSYGNFFKRMNFYGAVIVRDSVATQRPKVDQYLAGKIQQ